MHDFLGKNISKKCLKKTVGCLRHFCVIFGLFCALSVQAAVIDIVELADGSFEIFSDGVRYGTASTRAGAEKVASKLGAGGNKINWTKASVNAGPTSGSSYSGYSTNTTVNAKGTTQTKFTTGGKDYIYEQTAAGKTGFKDPITGKYTSRPNMPPATTAQPGSNLPATTAKPGTNLPATTAKPGAASTASKVGVGGAVMGALGVAGGAYMIYDSVAAKDTKTTWGDVGEGALGGFTATQGLVALNAIPVGGQIAYGTAVAVGTVIGASGAAAKMFSETDCELDPVTGQYACCNVSNLTNIQARLVNIGDEMFADFPYVRTCMQGKNKFESDWVTARFLDDHWSEKGEVKFCSGWVMPADGDYRIQAYGSSEAEGKVCWRWECADANMVRSGDKCVVKNANNSGAVQGDNVLNEIVVVANEIKAGDPCPSDRLPQFATAGKYVANGVNKQTGLKKWKCAATACKDGTYLVVNDKSVSQGWCVATSYCDKVSGSSLNIIDGKNTDLKCVSKDGTSVVVSGDSAAPKDDVVLKDEVNDEKQNVKEENENLPVVEQTPCELGEKGYLVFEGECISDAEYQRILKQRHEQAVAASKQAIKNAADVLDSISSGFGVSVWKNEDGGFNTSRLVSDSVAGVVLGTAGGLITSSVVKKNQIKGGFEDIKCTVGGQVVAGFGDEFRVGIQ